MDNTELLTADETADYLKISKATIWQWCRTGQIPAVKIGRQWRIRRRYLEAMLDPRTPDPDRSGEREGIVVFGPGFLPR